MKILLVGAKYSLRSKVLLRKFYSHNIKLEDNHMK